MPVHIQPILLAPLPYGLPLPVHPASEGAMDLLEMPDLSPHQSLPWQPWGRLEGVEAWMWCLPVCLRTGDWRADTREDIQIS